VTPFAATRTSVHAHHALIAPDSRMRDTLPAWPVTAASLLVSPRLGGAAPAEHSLLWAHLADGERAHAPGPGLERFVYLLDGTVEVMAEGTRRGLERDGYAFLPADLAHELRALAPSRLLVFERRYRALAGGEPPPVVVGQAEECSAQPFLGAAGVTVRTLLPDEPSFDLSMAVMGFRPGATLPLMEVHEAEHSLYLLAGAGILRAGDAWHPVREGDAVWLGPHCPHWFAGIGESETSYLIYKDGRRGPWPPSDRP
jgi:(S)-ureidoglycine aminohydrolase